MGTYNPPQAHTLASHSTKDNTMFANVQITGGGVITWNGTHLLWTTRLIAMPVEKTEFSSDGFINMDCPTSGTVVYYPEGGGTSTVACTADGIPIDAWEALYYRFVRGSASGSDRTRFCVVHYKNADWSPDDGWILLATRNGDATCESVKVAVGVTFPIAGGVYDVDAVLSDWIASTAHSHALAAGATDVTALAAELNLLDLATLTAGELLVATGAASAAWQSTGVLLDTPTIQGTVAAGTGLTLPAFTLGGTMDANSQALINVLDLDLGTESITGTFSATLTAANAGTAWLIMSKDTSDILRPRLALSGGVDTAVWAWVNSTHTGIVLSGALDANSQNIDNVNSILDVNSAQVVGTRVVDARSDDAINSGDATTDGVIDALRDAMITHGLIAAA